MKQIKFFVMIIISLLIIACGKEKNSSMSEGKSGYWEIQNSNTRKTLYKGFLTSKIMMLNQNGQSWSGQFIYSKRSRSFRFKNFSPLNKHYPAINLTFIMNDNETKSKPVILQEEEVELILHSSNLPQGTILNPTNFKNLQWIDQENEQNTLETSSNGSDFKIVSSKSLLWEGVCTFQGKIPTTVVNYALVFVAYSCNDGSKGKTSLHMATTAQSDELLVGFDSVIGFEEETNLEANIILFR